MIELPSTRINEKAIKAWRISAALWGLLLFVPPAGYSFLTSTASFNLLYLIIGSSISLVLYVFFVWIFPPIRWRRWRYDISENEIDLFRGFIIQKRTVIPINRIQHVDTSQGPIYKSFKLSSVQVSSAATTHEIPALDDVTAAEVRTKISNLVRQVKEDV